MKYVASCLMLMLVSPALMAQSLPGGFIGAYVEGNVSGSDTGKPLVGAKIDVIGAKVSKNSIKANNGCGTGFALSAADGNFAVGVGQNNRCVSKKHPINGKYYISVSKRGYLPQVEQIDFAAHNTNAISGLIFRLTPSHASVQGHVLSDGNALPYAYVWLMKDPYAMMMHPPKGHGVPLFSEYPMVRTDAYGKFNIAVSPGSYVVMASKTGYQLITKTVNPSAQQMYQRMASIPFMPPQTRAKLQQLDQPQLGVYVSVATDGVANADLALAKAAPVPGTPGFMKTSKFSPDKMILTGEARTSPDNVLFFTSLAPEETGRYVLGVVRSRTLLGAGKADPFKSHIKSFNFLQYGYPGGVGCRYHRDGHISVDYCVGSVLSFTDPTARPGVKYYYYIFEAPPYSVAPGGEVNFMQLGTPYSNAVQLVTH